MYEKIFPSHIVLYEHHDVFTGEFIKHPFVVWKRQGFKSVCKSNVYGLRITTKVNHKANYKVEIIPSETNSLKKKSFVCTDSIFLLDYDKCEVIGQLTSSEFLKVIESRINMHNEELSEAMHTLNNITLYECRKL